ncbi:hypothetical protein F7R12_16445 [Pseudomonas tolaasii]|nr:hypothetical protein F7R12_16445 [Pseudomonas tolaasii]
MKGFSQRHCSVRARNFIQLNQWDSFLSNVRIVAIGCQVPDCCCSGNTCLCGRLCVGAGLPAMRAPRWIRQIRLMRSQASQFPQKSGQGFSQLPSATADQSPDTAHSPAANCA